MMNLPAGCNSQLPGTSASSNTGTIDRLLLSSSSTTRTTNKTSNDSRTKKTKTSPRRSCFRTTKPTKFQKERTKQGGNDLNSEASTTTTTRPFLHIQHLTDKDIVCGRGRTHWKNPGNVRFFAVVRASIERYVAAPRRIDKTDVVTYIVSVIRKTGARFVKLDPQTQQGYVTLSDDKARMKIGHAIRDYVRKAEKKEQKKQKNNKKRKEGESTTTTTTISSSVTPPIPNTTGSNCIEMEKSDEETCRGVSPVHSLLTAKEQQGFQDQRSSATSVVSSSDSTGGTLPTTMKKSSGEKKAPGQDCWWSCRTTRKPRPLLLQVPLSLAPPPNPTIGSPFAWDTTSTTATSSSTGTPLTTASSISSSSTTTTALFPPRHWRVAAGTSPVRFFRPGHHQEFLEARSTTTTSGASTASTAVGEGEHIASSFLTANNDVEMENCCYTTRTTSSIPVTPTTSSTTGATNTTSSRTPTRTPNYSNCCGRGGDTLAGDDNTTTTTTTSTTTGKRMRTIHQKDTLVQPLLQQPLPPPHDDNEEEDLRPHNKKTNNDDDISMIIEEPLTCSFDEIMDQKQEYHTNEFDLLKLRSFFLGTASPPSTAGEFEEEEDRRREDGDDSEEDDAFITDYVLNLENHLDEEMIGNLFW